MRNWKFQGLDAVPAVTVIMRSSREAGRVFYRGKSRPTSEASSHKTEFCIILLSINAPNKKNWPSTGSARAGRRSAAIQKPACYGQAQRLGSCELASQRPGTSPDVSEQSARYAAAIRELYTDLIGLKRWVGWRLTLD